MLVLKRGQPTLLYLVPVCLISVLLCAFVRKEVQAIYKYDEDEEIKAIYDQIKALAAEYKQSNQHQNHEEARIIYNLVKGRFTNSDSKSAKAISTYITNHKKDRVHRHSTHNYLLNQILLWQRKTLTADERKDMQNLIITKWDDQV